MTKPLRGKTRPTTAAESARFGRGMKKAPRPKMARPKFPSTAAGLGREFLGKVEEGFHQAKHKLRDNFTDVLKIK
eukprot:scaffold975_cov394-Pavlova_lutheri.AAC.38